MFRMTVTAGGVWIVLLQASMQGFYIAQIFLHLSVTDQTSIIHRVLIPGCDMAGFAISFDLGMRGDTTKRLAGFGVQRTRAEHRAAGDETIGHDREHRDQCGDDASP